MVSLAMNKWPDGEPVTPWADPWHDVLGDIQAFKRVAEQNPRASYSEIDEILKAEQEAEMSDQPCTCEKGNDAQHVTSTVEDCAVHGTRFGGL
jgi:hypothetical protein